ncbi:YqiA/YcfP family alpha/beta fold hydrolase [Marinomonas sp. THO17]|uniref:YqiA/YcfP family alpha/beta fold hydrolase n=1 Tax=Marinomonas sp. THO17 TaxID=3149048 RepID=UPI00336C0D47
MAVLIYIHGFNSSERSHKASVMQQAAKQAGVPNAVLSPRLSWRPKQAIAELESLIESHLSAGVALIGSSLGGFYGAYLAEKYQLPCIMVNPAVDAPVLLTSYLGPQHNPYTGEEYILTQQHMMELESLVIEKPTAELYWLMLQEGDEVLDYRAALKAFPKTAKLTLEANGDHSFVDFQRYASEILQFAQILDN